MTHFLAQADAQYIPLADNSCDLVIGSPPYCDARFYQDKNKHSRNCIEWVDWMLPITKEACRVSKGLVLWVCAGVTRDWCYWPACEGLMWEWYKNGNRMWRPCFWHRIGIPGSGGEQWLRADVEYVLAFTKCEAKIPWANNTANGHPPKWGPGGEMSHRLSSGNRVNQWGNVGSKKGMGAKNADGSLKASGRPSHTKCGGGSRRQNGDVKIGGYDMPVLANPGNLLKINVGGGMMGHSLASINEAPFVIDLPKWFIRSHCKPNGLVLDPFSGSGSTGQAAIEEGRRYIGFDIRMNQCELGKRRLNHSQPPLFVSGAAQ